MDIISSVQNRLYLKIAACGRRQLLGLGNAIDLEFVCNTTLYSIPLADSLRSYPLVNSTELA